ncbi:MAG: hypothetical protein H6Q13_140 [Bacteroidetes bacterium]|nr:hypothetical protein [Bacteroidota bacterium]
MRKTFFLVLLINSIIICYGQDYKAKVQNGKYGYVNSSDQWIINPKFDYASDFKSGIGEVQLNSKHGIVDSRGNYISPCKWDDMSLYYLAESGCISVELNGKFGVIDKEGKEILPCIYDKSSSINQWGYINVAINGKNGLCDKTGKQIVQCKYEKVYYYPDDNGNIDVELNNKKGICNSHGTELFSCIYDETPSLYKNYYTVVKDGKKGLFDKNGSEIVPCRYDDVYLIPDEHGAIKVKINQKEGIVNDKGDEIIPSIYESIVILGDFYYVKSNGKEGVYNVVGKEILSCNYESISNFGNYFNTTLNGKEICYDFNGNLIPNPLDINTYIDKGIKLSGNWSYQIDYSQQTVRITGAKIENNATEGKCGTVKISLYLTDTKYTGGSITGYALIDYQLDQLSAGYYFQNIDKLLNFKVIPPSNNYYVTLLLMEYTTTGFVIKDYLCFDDLLAFDNRKTEKVLNAVADGLNAISNSLNNYNSINTNSYTSPNNTNNNRSNGHIEAVVCDICHGTGKSVSKEYPPTFGQGRSIMKTSCPYCGDIYVHSHKNCFSCHGTGKVQKWVP